VGTGSREENASKQWCELDLAGRIKMPVYEYLCNDCGPFFCMPSDKRKAHATNERSANAPKTVGEYKASHGPGCGCCSTKPSRLVKQTRSGAKSFPTARPWMISH